MHLPKPTTLRNPEALRRNIAAGSRNPLDFTELAIHVFTGNQYNEAIDLYERALDLADSNVEKARIVFELMSLLVWLGRLEPAGQRAKEVADLLSQESNTAEVMFLRGMMHATKGEMAVHREVAIFEARAGLRYLDAFIAHDAASDEISVAYTTAAHLRNILGDYNETVRLCKQCLALQLSTAQRYDCFYEIIEALYLLGDYNQALSYIAEALKSGDGDDEKLAYIYYLYGLVSRSVDNPKAARSAYETAISELNKRDYKAHGDLLLLGDIYIELAKLDFDLEDLDQSIATLEKGLSLLSEDTSHRREMLALLGQTYHAKGLYSESAQSYLLVSQSPNTSEAERASVYQGLGKVYFDLGKWALAIDAFEKAADVFSWTDDFYGDLLLWLGDSYARINNYVAARECYTRIIDAASAPPKYKDLAKLYLDQLPVVPATSIH